MDKRQKLLLSGGISLLYCLLVLPFIERLAFAHVLTATERHISYGLKALFAIVLFFIVYFIVHFICELRAKNKIHRNWLKFSAIHFGVLFVIFLLVYPGHWVADEFRIVSAVKHYGLEYNWQNYFTNIFYTFSMYIIPTATSIIFFQIVLASTVIGYITAQFQRLFKDQRLAYLLLVPFFFFPVIINELYPLRGTMYAYIELLFIAKLLFIHYKFEKPRNNKAAALIGFAVLITLLSFWRSEGVYYLLLLPVLAVYIQLFTRKSYKTVQPYIVTAICLLIVCTGYAITKATSDNRYLITAFLNPISTMIQKPLNGSNLPERLAIMDRTVDVSVVKKFPSYNETPAFWNGGVREDYDQHLASFEKQYIYLILNNPGPFLDNRFRLLLSTNSFDPLASVTLGTFDSRYKQNGVAQQFIETNHFSEPINIAVKTKVTSFLACLGPDGKFNALGHIVWNAIIPIVLLLCLGVYKLIRKQWLWAGVVSLVLLRVVIVFLTAPANYFFYYLPAYLTGYFLLFLTAALYLDRRRATTHSSLKR